MIPRNSFKTLDSSQEKLQLMPVKHLETLEETGGGDLKSGPRDIVGFGLHPEIFRPH